MFYEITKGETIYDDDLEVTIRHIHLMDIGTANATEFEAGEEVLEILEANPELEKCSLGTVHSHHTMSAFFSTTDENEFKEGMDLSEKYMMLIVSNKGPWVCKIGSKIEVEEEKMSFSWLGKKRSIVRKIKKEQYRETFFKIVDEDDIITDTFSRIKEVEAEKEEKRKKEAESRPTTYGYGQYGGYGKQGYRNFWEEDDYDYHQSWKPKAGIASKKKQGPSVKKPVTERLGIIFPKSAHVSINDYQIKRALCKLILDENSDLDNVSNALNKMDFRTFGGAAAQEWFMQFKTNLIKVAEENTFALYEVGMVLRNLRDSIKQIETGNMVKLKLRNNMEKLESDLKEVTEDKDIKISTY